jgi:hypothetical protein
MNRILSSLLVLSVAACGNDGVSIDDFSDAYIDAFCEGAVKCGSQPSVAACKASAGLDSYTFLTLIDGAKSGKITYNEDQAGACLDGFRSTTCSFEGLQGEDPCDAAFTGTIPMGGACVISAECAGGASCEQTDQNCDRDTMCCPGTCGAPSVVVAAGASCGENDICPANQYCKPPATGDVGTCTALLTSAGAACDSFFACANPMICNGFADMPTCELPVATGETCDPDALIPCLKDQDHCDDVTMKCAGPKADGAACEFSSECELDSTCAGATTTTCQANVAVGGTCSDTTADCLGSLECTNGTCQLAPAGMSCI